MNPHDTELYEMLLDQYRQLRDLKANLEALKSMMFEHRPAFVPAFQQKLSEVAESHSLDHFTAAMRKLEDRLAQMF